MRCKTLLPLFLFLMTVLSVQGEQKEFILQAEDGIREHAVTRKS